MALNAQKAASSKVGGAASAALSVAGDIGGALIGQAFANRNLKLQERANKRIAKFNQQLEYENQRNAAILQMQGLKNAGLNVGAMLGQPPQVASTSSDGVGMPASPKLEGLGQNSVAAYQAQKLNDASIRLAEANADKAEAEAEGTKIDNKTRDDKNRLNLDSIRKDLSVKDQQIVQSKATVDNMQKTFEVFEKNSAKQRWALDFDAYLKFQQAEKIAKDILWYDREKRAQISKLMSSANLDAWQANVCMVSFLNQAIDYYLKNRGIENLKNSKLVKKDKNGNIIDEQNALDYSLMQPTLQKWLQQSLMEAGLSEAEAHSRVNSNDWIQWYKALNPLSQMGSLLKMAK